MTDEVEHTYRSRKFGLAVASFIAGNIHFYIGILPAEHFSDLIMYVLGLYAIGSVGDKFAKGMNR